MRTYDRKLAEGHILEYLVAFVLLVLHGGALYLGCVEKCTLHEGIPFPAMFPQRLG